MHRQEPEQPNTPGAPEEYRLEDILREFGRDGQQTGPVSGDTVVFRPIRTASPDPQPDAPVKIFGQEAQTPAQESSEAPKASETPEKSEPPKRLRRRRSARAEPEKEPEEAPEKPKTAALHILPETPKSEKPEEQPVRRVSAAKKRDRVARDVSHKETKPQKAAEPASIKELLALCYKGLGASRLSLLGAAFVLLLQMLFLLYYAVPWSFLPFLQSYGRTVTFVLALLSVLLSGRVLLSGVGDLLHLRIGLNALGVVAVLSVLVHTLFTPPDGTQSFCPVLSLLLFLLQYAEHTQRVGLFFTLRTLNGFDAPVGIHSAPQFLDYPAPLRRGKADLADYMEHFTDLDLPQKVFRVYATALLPLSLAGAYLFSSRGKADFFTAWLLLLLGAFPFCGTFSYSYPFRSLSCRLARLGGALCGWRSARIFGGKHTIILRDDDLFPRNGVSFNGMKLYGAYSAERVIAYALAALDAADNPLQSVFEAQLQSMHGKHYRVSSFRFYDNNGIGAEVMGDVVLVGSLDFAQSMGVHMPDGTRVRQAVYVSINGELAGVFAIKYRPNASTRIGLHAVLSNRNFSVVLATRDFLISPDLLAAKYELSTDTVRFPAFPERVRLSNVDSDDGAEQGALIVKDAFGAFASTVSAGHVLRTASLLSMGICLFSGVFGLAVCALLLLWDAANVASPMHLAVFQLVWACLNGLISLLLLKI